MKVEIKGEKIVIPHGYEIVPLKSQIRKGDLFACLLTVSEHSLWNETMEAGSDNHASFILYIRKTHKPQATANFYQLTKLEKFVWQNRDRGFDILATEINRTENVIAAAYGRAMGKVIAAGRAIKQTATEQKIQTGELL